MEMQDDERALVRYLNLLVSDKERQAQREALRLSCFGADYATGVDYTAIYCNTAQYPRLEWFGDKYILLDYRRAWAQIAANPDVRAEGLAEAALDGDVELKDDSPSPTP